MSSPVERGPAGLRCPLAERVVRSWAGRPPWTPVSGAGLMRAQVSARTSLGTSTEAITQTCSGSTRW